MSDGLAAKLDRVHDEVIKNRNTTERALGALGERIATVEQWKAIMEKEVPYVRTRLDSIDDKLGVKLDNLDEKVDRNSVAVAKWSGFVAAVIMAFEVLTRLL